MSYFGDISITYHEVGSNDLMENNNYFIFNKNTKRVVLFFLFGILLIILSMIGIELYRRKSTSFQDILGNNTFSTTISTSQSSSSSSKINGTFNSSFTCQYPSYPVYNKNGTTVAGITDKEGSDSQHLFYPGYVYLNSKKDIFIVDKFNQRIVKYSSNNVQEGGTRVGGPSFFVKEPRGLYINHQNDDIYVLDYGADGRYRVQYLALHDSGYEATDILLGFNGACFGMDIDDNLNIYISESSRHRIVKWFAPQYKEHVVVAGNGIAGSELNQLNNPQGIYIDRINNDLYIVDTNRIQLWPNGAMIGQSIVKNGVFGAKSIKGDCHGNLYVVQPNVIKFFSPSVEKTGLEGIILVGIPTTYPELQTLSTIDYFSSANDMYLDQQNGDLYVVDSVRQQVRKYTIND